MALSANTVLEVRAGGSDTNGGGYVTGSSGTDYSQQNAAQYSVTDGVTNGTTTITSATANFGADVVGNLIYVQGGTGSVTAGWYQIISRTNATTIVVDRSTGLTAGTGVTLKIGGALASPGQAAAIAVLGNRIFVKYNAAVYSMTSASSNVAAGVCTLAMGVVMVSYDTTRTVTNVDANRSTIQTNVSTATQLTGLSAGVVVRNFILDGNSQTASNPTGGNVVFSRCQFKNFNTTATSSNNRSEFCTATLNSAAVFTGNSLFCEAYANTSTPFIAVATGSIIGCLSYANTGASTDGFSNATNNNSTVGNVAYNNGRDGFVFTDTSRSNIAANNISVSNGRYGFNWAGTNDRLLSYNNAAYNNTSGAQNGTVTTFNFLTLTADPFVDAANGNFALNNTAGGGAACRAAGYPAVFPAGLTSNYADVGAAQAQPLGGSSVPDFGGGWR
jgi:hypothetical protein